MLTVYASASTAVLHSVIIFGTRMSVSSFRPGRNRRTRSEASDTKASRAVLSAVWCCTMIGKNRLQGCFLWQVYARRHRYFYRLSYLPRLYCCHVGRHFSTFGYGFGGPGQCVTEFMLDCLRQDTPKYLGTLPSRRIISCQPPKFL